jgi:hypothetical protein
MRLHLKEPTIPLGALASKNEYIVLFDGQATRHLVRLPDTYLVLDPFNCFGASELIRIMQELVELAIGCFPELLGCKLAVTTDALPISRSQPVLLSDTSWPDAKGLVDVVTVKPWSRNAPKPGSVGRQSLGPTSVAKTNGMTREVEGMSHDTAQRRWTFTDLIHLQSHRTLVCYTVMFHKRIAYGSHSCGTQPASKHPPQRHPVHRSINLWQKSRRST